MVESFLLKIIKETTLVRLAWQTLISLLLTCIILVSFTLWWILVPLRLEPISWSYDPNEGTETIVRSVNHSRNVVADWRHVVYAPSLGIECSASGRADYEPVSPIYPNIHREFPISHELIPCLEDDTGYSVITWSERRIFNLIPMREQTLRISNIEARRGTFENATSN